MSNQNNRDSDFISYLDELKRHIESTLKGGDLSVIEIRSLLMDLEILEHTKLLARVVGRGFYRG